MCGTRENGEVKGRGGQIGDVSTPGWVEGRYELSVRNVASGRDGAERNFWSGGLYALQRG